MSTDTKHPLKSKTIVGLIVTVLALLLAQFGVELTGSETAEAVGAVTSLVGITVAVYGRWKADKPLKL